VSNIFTFW